MSKCARSVFSIAVVLRLLAAPLQASQPDFTALSSAYDEAFQPLLKQYCVKCHGGDRVEGEVDLGLIETGAGAVQRPELWQRANEMLSNKLMPPADAPQPTVAERSRMSEWLEQYLVKASKSQSNDPGRVVLRRLSNAEYTYTIQDLTHVASLTPASTFPGDGAAGEGFTNVGNSLAMSPELLTKLLDASKDIASHAVLLPNGFRFSQNTTSRDWTDELIAEIRQVYTKYTVPISTESMQLQGVEWGGSNGGRIPLAKYFAATIAEREALRSGQTSLPDVALKYDLSPTYLQHLWDCLNSEELSPLLKSVRNEWLNSLDTDAAALETQVAGWQRVLWTFSPVGLLGRRGGPAEWMTPINPVVSRQDVQFRLPVDSLSGDFTLSLTSSDAGDGHDHDVVVWQRPRLMAPGRPELLLRDITAVAHQYRNDGQRVARETTGCLAAISEVSSTVDEINWSQLAQKHGVRSTTLQAWAEYLGVRTTDEVEVSDRFLSRENLFGGNNKVLGWGNNATPYVAANPTDDTAEFPGPIRPHGVVVHPSFKQQVAIGWMSPLSSRMQISLSLKRAMPDGGNGIGWSLELRRGSTRQVLASGRMHTDDSPVKEAAADLSNVAILKGDFVSIIIDPLNEHHVGDLTAVEFELRAGDGRGTWNLANDVANNIFDGNPHSDRAGRAGIWSFYSETADSKTHQLSVPPRSSLAKWREATTDVSRQKCAEDVQSLLMNPASVQADPHNAALRKQLVSISGPLLGAALHDVLSINPSSTNADAALFGRRPDRTLIASEDLSVQAPLILDFTIPKELCAGARFVATAMLDGALGKEGSVQCFANEKKTEPAGPIATRAASPDDKNRPLHQAALKVRSFEPILVNENTDACNRVVDSFEDFRRLFPAAVCYSSVVPHDETTSVKLFHRDDKHLVRLALSPDEAAKLDRLWSELHYVSKSSLAQLNAYDQLLEAARELGNYDDLISLKACIEESAATFRQQLLDSEPSHLAALNEFASRAFRRPLTSKELDSIIALYRKLRNESVPHEDAFRVSLAHIFVAPAFLYRIEVPPNQSRADSVSDWELATRLSYLLWSSTPDDELRAAAVSGRLRDKDVLVAQARRMLADNKTRRLALEFACQWLHLRDFDKSDDKSERHFPTYLELRDDMHEESIRFFTHLFQSNSSILDIIECDYAFLNEGLARHYGIPDVKGPEWRLVQGVSKYNRGGILAQATVLASQSGASRTSPILRGTWISETILGERLPKPPKGVPPLPEEVDTEKLTVRQLVEKHVSDSKCAVCHRRIDPYGFSLEAFDAIGRFRTKDHADQPIDTQVTTMDGREFAGLEGLRNYVLTERRDSFVRNFCKKLLGFALGRSVQLSDRPLLDEMVRDLQANDYKFASALEAIVRSHQFCEIEGRDSVCAE